MHSHEISGAFIVVPKTMKEIKLKQNTDKLPVKISRKIDYEAKIILSIFKWIAIVFLVFYNNSKLQRKIDVH